VPQGSHAGACQGTRPYATANLLLTFCPQDKEWWEYLDQIWDAAQTADRTPLAVLPALMLRARKHPTQAKP
jgi:hypothetical protein